MADKQIDFKRHNFSEGDIHSNGRIKFQNGNPSTHTGHVTSKDRVEIRKKNTIDGDVICGEDVKLYDDATVTGTVTENAAVDVVPIPSIPAFSYGEDNIEVPKNGWLELPSGNYKNVKVQQNASLLFSSGTYNLKRLDMNNNSKLEVTIVGSEAVTINIDNNLDINNDVVMNVIDGASENVTFNVGGNGVHIRDRSVWFGSIIAPDAKVKLQKETFFKGTICARQIELHRRVIVMHHSSTAPLPKVLAENEGENLELGELPTQFELSQNYPNPFNPTTNIRFSIPQAGMVTLKVYNIRGRLVKTLVNGFTNSGYHQVDWNGTDENSVKVASGIYFYHLLTKDSQKAKKMVLLQ